MIEHLWKLKYNLDFQQHPYYKADGMFSFWSTAKNALCFDSIGFGGEHIFEMRCLIDFLRWSVNPVPELTRGLYHSHLFVKAYCAEGLYRLGAVIPPEVTREIPMIPNTTGYDYRGDSFDIIEFINKNNDLVEKNEGLARKMHLWKMFKRGISAGNKHEVSVLYYYGFDVLLKYNNWSVAALAYYMNKRDISLLAMKFESDFSRSGPGVPSLIKCAEDKSDAKTISLAKRIQRDYQKRCKKPKTD